MSQKYDIELVVTKRAEFTALVPDEVSKKGNKAIRVYLDRMIDNELDYAETTEKFKLIKIDD